MECLQLSLFIKNHDMMSYNEYRLDLVLCSIFIYNEMQRELTPWTWMYVCTHISLTLLYGM